MIDCDRTSVRSKLQRQYPELSLNHPFVAMDFGDGQVSSLMTGGRLIDVHRNLPSKGKDCELNEDIKFESIDVSSQGRSTNLGRWSLRVLPLHAR